MMKNKQVTGCPPPIIFKTGYLQALDITDELIEIIKDNQIVARSIHQQTYLETRIRELINKYCRRTGRIPFEIEEQ